MPWNLAYSDDINRGNYSPGYPIGANQRFWAVRAEGPPEGFIRYYGVVQLLTFDQFEGQFRGLRRAVWPIWYSATIIDLGASLPNYFFQLKVSEKGPEIATYKLYFFS